MYSSDDDEVIQRRKEAKLVADLMAAEKRKEHLKAKHIAHKKQKKRQHRDKK